MSLEKLLADLESNSWVDRQMAVEGLKSLGGDTVIGGLEKALGDENTWVRVAAAEGLLQVAGGEAIHQVARYLAAEKDPQGALKVVEALGRLNDKRALEPLLACLWDEHHLVAATAAWGLGRLPGDGALDELARAVTDAPAWETREQASIALGKSGQKRFRGALEAALQDPKNAVRREAAAALGRLGDLEAVPALQAALADLDWRVVETAKDSLAALKK